MNKRIARKITKHVYEYINFFIIKPKGYSRKQVETALLKCGADIEYVTFYTYYYFGGWMYWHDDYN